MIKLPVPEFTFRQVLRKILSKMEDGKLKAKILCNMSEFLSMEQFYTDKVNEANLYTMAPYERQSPQTLPGDLKKNEYNSLYHNQFRRRGGRQIYDKLMANSNEKCPYCGGIGIPNNLDHYLPLAYFPQFSILPYNLVPSCRDCNMGGKRQAFANAEQEQVLHPYFDDEKFFNEQWIFAYYEEGDPGVAEYFVKAPDHWSETDKQRVKNHFEMFHISRAYSVRAAEELSTIIPTIKNFDGPDDWDLYKNSIIIPQIEHAPFMNYWKRILYQALLSTNLI